MIDISKIILHALHIVLQNLDKKNISEDFKKYLTKSAWECDVKSIAVKRVLQSELVRNYCMTDRDLEYVSTILSDHESIRTFRWILGFRILLLVFNREYAHKLMPGDLNPKKWKDVLSMISCNQTLPECLTESSKTFFWGFGLYVLKEICDIKKGDIVIDVGAFVGDSTLYFSDCCKPNGKVYAFEPSPENYVQLLKNINSINSQNVKAIMEGVWSEEGIADFAISGAGTKLISKSDQISTSHQIKITTIDKFVESERLTAVNYIKLDMNGGIRNALFGAVKTINRFKPKVCFSLHYNTGMDYTQMPLLFNSLFPFSYKFYLRHFSLGHRYTVLFCVPL